MWFTSFEPIKQHFYFLVYRSDDVVSSWCHPEMHVMILSNLIMKSIINNLNQSPAFALKIVLWISWGHPFQEPRSGFQLSSFLKQQWHNQQISSNKSVTSSSTSNFEFGFKQRTFFESLLCINLSITWPSPAFFWFSRSIHFCRNL